MDRKNVTVGILAHVDAGKTTLSESILYLCGNIRKPGRVDHGDAFLDTYELERNRGITIFSKQAVIALGDKTVTLLDTPGHVDFSTEMERTLQVLDYAILVVNAADGIQSHTRTLWSLLDRYKVPVFLFINKMDQEGTDREKLLEELREKFSEGCLPFDVLEGRAGETIKSREEFWEEAAVCDEAALEEYLQNGGLSQQTVDRMIVNRQIFPCYFGSALKIDGVQEFLHGMEKYLQCAAEQKSAEAFGARVYKISRDSQGNRLTHMKITGGVLKVKDSVCGEGEQGRWEEKVNQIRIYSGEKYQTVPEAEAGMVCAVTGLSQTAAGEGIGEEKGNILPFLEPVLSYRIILPEGCDAHTMFRNLSILEEEEPMLRIEWKEELQEIHVRLMGEVQIDILKSLIEERFHVQVDFDAGNIVYKETIRQTVEGVGHFEPLRHYAEVHLILEPGEQGSGIVIDTDCSEDMLDKNWQRLILTHLAEKTHRGVLTGAAVTDLKITLAAGKAHLKHTEGGDFRQATYRAVRQGLMQADSMLLEPYYDFRLEVPTEMLGRAINDIQRMHGEFQTPEAEGGVSVLTGSAPVAAMREYQMEVTGYTRGQGRLYCNFSGYAPCHNEQEVIEACGYDADSDLDNPTGSVFCSHGAGYYVPWQEVPQHMHLENQLEKRRKQENAAKAPAVAERKTAGAGGQRTAGKVSTSWNAEEEKELEEIFMRTYGKIEHRRQNTQQTVVGEAERKAKKKQERLREYLLVDGYNIIFAWEDLKELAQVNIEAARNKLMDVLCNYQGFRKCTVILVFDAYKVEGDALEIQKYHNIYVVYTKEAETADQYIEKVVHEIGRKYQVIVATSDGVEQVVTLGQGGRLISAREFAEEVEIVRRQIREETEKQRVPGKNYLFHHMDEELAKEMEEVRLGKKDIRSVE